jgi:hypothetical protein
MEDMKLNGAYAKPTFSLGIYDSDGDVVEGGVYLWFGDMCIKVADSVEDYLGFVEHLRAIGNEIKDIFGN